MNDPIKKALVDALLLVRGKHGCGALTLPEADLERVDAALTLARAEMVCNGTHHLVAAGHFRRDITDAWREVSRHVPNSTILYHAPGWPRKGPPSPFAPVANMVQLTAQPEALEPLLNGLRKISRSNPNVSYDMARVVKIAQLALRDYWKARNA